jgi:PIN domain nuclease of toxin-antitoxin system
MNCLLDTCVFLWLALEPTRLSKHAVEVINNAPRRFFSSAGLMEIAIKHSAGKLPSWDWQIKTKNRASLLAEFLFLPCPIRAANALVPLILLRVPCELCG